MPLVSEERWVASAQDTLPSPVQRDYDGLPPDEGRRDRFPVPASSNYGTAGGMRCIHDKAVRIHERDSHPSEAGYNPGKGCATFQASRTTAASEIGGTSVKPGREV